MYNFFKFTFLLLLALILCIPVNAKFIFFNNNDYPINAYEYYLEGIAYYKNKNYKLAEISLKKAVNADINNLNFKTVLGALYLEIGQEQKALDQLIKVVKAEPDNIKARVLYAKALLKAKDYKRAIEQFEAIKSTNKDLIYISYNLGFAYYNLGEYELALENFNLTKIQDPENIKIYYFTANCEKKLKLWAASIIDYKFILSKNNDQQIIQDYADALVEIKDYKNAEIQYLKLLETNPDNINLFLKLYEVNLKLNLKVKAISFLKKAVEVDSRNAYIRYLLAKDYEEKNILIEALNQYELALNFEEDENKKDIYKLAIANIYLKLSKPAQSEKFFNELILKNPENINLKIKLAELKIKSNQYNQAYNLYKDILNKNPDLIYNISFLNNYILCTNALKRYDENELILKKYLEKNPKDQKFWFVLLNLQKNQNKDYDAVNTANEIKNRFFDSEEVLKQLVHIQLLLKDFKGAELTYKRILELNLSEENLFNFVDFLVFRNQTKHALEILKDEKYKNLNQNKIMNKTAYLLFISGDQWSSATEYQKILLENPNNQEALLNLAQIYFNMGQYEEAINLYARLTLLKPKDIHILENYAYSLDALQKESETIKVYEKILKLNPEHLETLYSLGVIYFEKGNSESAKKYWKKYLFLSPEGIHTNDILLHFPNLKIDN